MIEASLRDEGGEVIHRWMIAPPKDSIEAEAAMPFTAKTEFTDEKAVSVNLRFVAGNPKTVSEDAGNSPVPPAGDNIPPSDPLESSGSPAPVGVPPHPGSPPAHTGNSDHHP